MKNLALQRIQKISSYNPPLSGRRAFRGMLLDFNERTIPPSLGVQKSIQALLRMNKLQLYPEYGDLEAKISTYVGISANKIMITNGSDQAIDLIFRTFTQEGDTVIIPTPSFAMFSQSAEIIGNNILRPMYDKNDLSFPLDTLLGMITPLVKLIVLCNPNNPTGTFVAISDIERIAPKAENAILLVDEAYFEFSNLSAVSLIKKYPNIIIVRTLSKAFGIPSLRIGYVIAANIYIKELLKVRGPYDINMIAYTASLAALDDVKSAQQYVQEVMNDAKPMVEEFFTKNGIKFYQSAGNFLLYKPVIENEIEVLKKNGLLLRIQDKLNIENTVRLTIGTVSQMKKFITIYQNVILNKSKKRKIAFLDRDGTLLYEPQDTFQVDSIEKLKILQGVIKALKKLIKQEYELVIVTNQDGLGTSSFPKANFDIPQSKMISIFEKNGIKFKKVFICPHLSSKKCGCRKPKTGLIKKFLRDTPIDIPNSFVCGDRLTDKVFAENIGITYIPMLTNGNFYKALEKGKIL